MIEQCIGKHMIAMLNQSDQFRAALQSKGFVDVDLFDRFLDGFARTPEELEFSKKVRRGMATGRIWSDVILSGRGNWENVAHTAITPAENEWLRDQIKQKQNALIAQGKTDEAKDYNVHDLDPCFSRWEAWTRESYANWRHTKFDLVTQQLQIRDKLADDGFVSVRCVPDEPSSIRNYVAECLLAGLDDASYKRINASSSKGVFVAKAIATNLQLRISAKGTNWQFSNFMEADSYFDGKRCGRDSHPHFLQLNLGLHVRNGVSGRFSATPDCLIPLWSLVSLNPLYVRYRTATHLSAALAGWTAFYQMISGQIEGICKECVAS